jgi:PAS domain S-box-containing protein
MDRPSVKWILKKILLIDIYRSIAEDDIIAKQRFNLFRIFTLSAFIGIGIICYQSAFIFKVKTIFWLVLLALECIILFNYLLLNLHKKRQITVFISLLSCFIALHYVTYFSGGVRNSGMFYQIAFMLVAFMLLGSKKGKWFAVLCISNLVYFYFVTEYTSWVNYDFIGYSSSLINQDYLFTGLISLMVIGSLINNLESNKNIVISSITESRNKLSVINKELRKLSLVASKTDNAVAITNFNGTTEWINDGFARMFGYANGEIIGKNMMEMLIGLQTDKSALDALHVDLKNLVSCEIELLNYKKGKQPFWVHHSITPILDDNGKLSRFIYIMSNIDERKKSELKLEEYLRDLEKTNQELDKFAYVVSHDLKAPLRAIGNLTDWIEEDSGHLLTGSSSDNFKLIKGRVKRMELLINAILDYSKVSKRKGAEEIFSFRELIDDTIDLVAPASNCIVKINNEMPHYFGDRIKCQQIFLNLIGNAIKHNDKKDIEITISSEETSTHWKFSIHDNGPGIDARFHEKVFVIFQTLKARDEFESTGIGLAIVKKLVEEAGGTIWVESTIGAGATFFFTLPKNSSNPEVLMGLSNHSVTTNV